MRFLENTDSLPKQKIFILARENQFFTHKEKASYTFPKRFLTLVLKKTISHLIKKISYNCKKKNSEKLIF